MSTTSINTLKELEVPGTPLLLFDCTLSSGDVQRWSTHPVIVNGAQYLSRVLRHNVFDLTSSSELAVEGASTVSITLANADSFLSSIERNIGWKGAQLSVTFLFFDLANGVAASDSQVVFCGVANPPDQSTELTLRLSFTNRLNLQRVYLPSVRIQKSCPWNFPSDASQRQEAVSGGTSGSYAPFYQCGYSADQTNGVGNLNGTTPYTSCDYSRAQCQQRGMFSTDAQNNPTGRFGGIEFMPAAIYVRTYGEKGMHLSIPAGNLALYNDCVPLVYGTGWYEPPLVFARNDGNLTHCEVLLGVGPLSAIVKVIVNNTEIPVGAPGTNMTATGWYNVVSLGARNGTFDLDFTDSSGNPLGDPYGSMGLLSVVVPNRISDGSSLPEIEILIQGLLLPRFDTSGNSLDPTFTNNPAWVILDVLRRSGWSTGELDLVSFANVAARCDALVQTVDLNGNNTLIPRYQCNLLLTDTRSVGDIVRGICNGSAMFLTLSTSGLLQLNGEDTLAVQQPILRAGSNSTEALDGGWPAYEFGDNELSGILRQNNGASTLSVSSRATADTPNQYTVEFQDEFNQYQQDSLSLVDIDDSLLTGQNITTSLTALGLPNCDQATRAAALQLYKSVQGNTYVQFQTSMKGVGLAPGDIITITYAKEGFSRQPFRITKISPGVNFLSVSITAQLHDDSWYTAVNTGTINFGSPPGFEIGVPRPLVGSVLDSNGVPQFGVVESSVVSSDGSIGSNLSVSFSVPARPTASAAGIPLAGLNPQINTTGGTLAGGQALYYALSAVDATGAEGGLSFTIMASVPAGTNTNQVTLVTLSFSSTAAGFNVYRGANPIQLLLIAQNVPIATQFTDLGATALLQGPPDYNYDHANFYWRLELQPPESVDVQSATTVGNSTLNMLPNQYRGATVRIEQGTGDGQERTIAANSATTLTITPSWDIAPDTTSSFLIADSSWQFGASSAASPVSFPVPNREGVTLHISGRAANVRNEESDLELSPLTRWRISGNVGNNLDSDVAGQPTFGLYLAGQGTVDLVGIGFTSLDNTITVNAGTLTLAFWDELNGPSTILLSAAAGAGDTTLAVSTAISASAGDLLQVDAEVMLVQQDLSNGTTVQVNRGSHGSTATAHAAQTGVYALEKKIFIMPFAQGFFGSPASGSYLFPIVLPDVRIAAAELFVTNSHGNSTVAEQSFTNTSDTGLRTLSGGQLSIQVDGALAIQTNAAPPLLVDTSHSVRDVYAVVSDAPAAAPVVMEVTQNGQPFCQLTIPAGTTTSNVVDGFALGPLQAGAQVGLNITSVVQTANAAPGSDLTVTIRL
ncbi:MAG TPA: phage tail protein [Bryobacteraceae bacterium]|nr:phage tail protein [Bryobacteraceae bacterium]